MSTKGVLNHLVFDHHSSGGKFLSSSVLSSARVHFLEVSGDDLDIKPPLFNMLMAFYAERMQLALEAPQKVEQAILPVYWTLKNPRKPEQIGSCVVLRLKDQYFALSASHVFDEIGQNQLLVAVGNGYPLQAFSGERFSTARGPSGTHQDDPIDASVFHIQSEIHPEIKRIALSSNDVDLSEVDSARSIYMAAGFRVKKSHTSWKEARVKCECFPSQESDAEGYSLLKLDDRLHLAIAYENLVPMNGLWQKSPNPKGISGGAIIKVDGVSIKPELIPKQPLRQLLSAITIERRKQSRKTPGAIIGTRLRVHFKLIDTYLPGLLP